MGMLIILGGKGGKTNTNLQWHTCYRLLQWCDVDPGWIILSKFQDDSVTSLTTCSIQPLLDVKYSSGAKCIAPSNESKLLSKYNSTGALRSSSQMILLQLRSGLKHRGIWGFAGSFIMAVPAFHIAAAVLRLWNNLILVIQNLSSLSNSHFFMSALIWVQSEKHRVCFMFVFMLNTLYLRHLTSCFLYLFSLVH